MKLNLSVDAVLSTTRAVRRRLDITKPVPRALIDECLELFPGTARARARLAVDVRHDATRTRGRRNSRDSVRPPHADRLVSRRICDRHGFQESVAQAGVRGPQPQWLPIRAALTSAVLGAQLRRGLRETGFAEPPSRRRLQTPCRRSRNVISVYSLASWSSSFGFGFFGRPGFRVK